MQIGIHGIEPRDEECVKDLGVQWVKFPSWYLEAEQEDPAFVARLDLAEKFGLRTIVDLRTDRATHMSILIEYHKTRGDKPGDAYTDLTKFIAERAAAAVEKYQDRVQDWEFWGECSCPSVTGMSAAGDAYPLYLAAVHDAIKQVAPQARVWSAGNAVDLETTLLKGMIQDGAQDKFQVWNLHHYNLSHTYPLVNGVPNKKVGLEERIEYSSRWFRDSLGAMRTMLDEECHGQPFAATEWGHPVVYDQWPDRVKLQSFVLDGGVEGLWDTQAAPMFDAWLKVFADCGLQVLIYHCLRDTGPGALMTDSLGNVIYDRMHWGEFCGVLYSNGWKKSTYDVLREWAWRGREGEVSWS